MTRFPSTNLLIKKEKSELNLQLGDLYFIEKPYCGNNTSDFNGYDILLAMPTVMLPEDDYTLFLALALYRPDQEVYRVGFDHKTLETELHSKAKNISFGIDIQSLIRTFGCTDRNGTIRVKSEIGSFELNSLWLSCKGAELKTLKLVPIDVRLRDLSKWPYMARYYWAKNHLKLTDDQLSVMRNMDLDESIEMLQQYFVHRVYDFNPKVQAVIHKLVAQEKQRLAAETPANDAPWETAKATLQRVAKKNQLVPGHVYFTRDPNGMFTGPNTAQTMSVQYIDPKNGDRHFFTLRKDPLPSETALPTTYRLYVESDIVVNDQNKMLTNSELDEIGELSDEDMAAAGLKDVHVRHILQLASSPDIRNHDLCVLHIGKYNIHVLNWDLAPQVELLGLQQFVEFDSVHFVFESIPNLASSGDSLTAYGVNKYAMYNTSNSAYNPYSPVEQTAQVEQTAHVPHNRPPQAQDFLGRLFHKHALEYYQQKNPGSYMVKLRHKTAITGLEIEMLLSILVAMSSIRVTAYINGERHSILRGSSEPQPGDMFVVHMGDAECLHITYSTMNVIINEIFARPSMNLNHDTVGWIEVEGDKPNQSRHVYRPGQPSNKPVAEKKEVKPSASWRKMDFFEEDEVM